MSDDRDAVRLEEVRQQCAEYARKVVADWPPLTPAQRDKLTVIFASARNRNDPA